MRNSADGAPLFTNIVNPEIIKNGMSDIAVSLFNYYHDILKIIKDNAVGANLQIVTKIDETIEIPTKYKNSKYEVEFKNILNKFREKTDDITNCTVQSNEHLHKIKSLESTKKIEFFFQDIKHKYLLTYDPFGDKTSTFFNYLKETVCNKKTEDIDNLLEKHFFMLKSVIKLFNKNMELEAFDQKMGEIEFLKDLFIASKDELITLKQEQLEELKE